MNRRTKAEYAARLCFKLAFGAGLYAHACTRRRLRATRDKWLP